MFTVVRKSAANVNRYQTQNYIASDLYAILFLNDFSDLMDLE